MLGQVYTGPLDLCGRWIYVGQKKSGFFVLLLIKDENVCGIGHTEFRFQTLL